MDLVTNFANILNNSIRDESDREIFKNHCMQALKEINNGQEEFLCCLRTMLSIDDPHRRMLSIELLEKNLRPKQYIERQAGEIVLEWYKVEPYNEFIPSLEKIMENLGMAKK